jgi:hypothetical protein
MQHILMNSCLLKSVHLLFLKRISAIFQLQLTCWAIIWKIFLLSSLAHFILKWSKTSWRIGFCCILVFLVKYILFIALVSPRSTVVNQGPCSRSCSLVMTSPFESRLEPHTRLIYLIYICNFRLRSSCSCLCSQFACNEKPSRKD